MAFHKIKNNVSEMSNLLTELGLLTFEEYESRFQHWVQEKLTSSANPTSELVEFTTLNWVRSQRIQKTMSLNPGLLEEIAKLKNNYTWIVVTEAWCGDSAQNLPVIAAMANSNPEKIKLFIMLRDENPEFINNYLTNGARAIPKLIAIDETISKEAFVWGPRPSPAQEMLLNWKQNPGGKNWESFERDLHGWYAKDKTQAVQDEFLSLLKKIN
jgi:Thioredoxin